MYCARKVISVIPTWNPELERLTMYKYSDMEEIVEFLMVRLQTVKLGGRICNTSDIIGTPPFKKDFSPTRQSPQVDSKIFQFAKSPNLIEENKNAKKRKIMSHSPRRDEINIKFESSKIK